MNMENQLKKLNNAVSALQGSQARTRLLRLFDEGSFVEIDRFARDADMPSQAVVGYGTVEGCPVYAFSQDKQVYRGAIGKAQAAKICKAYQLASQNGAPLVGVFDSDGAKLNEGIDAMDAIAEILFASNNLSGVVPQIAVVAGACVGSSAIIAANSDFVVMSKDADYYLNPGDQNAAASIMAEDADAAIDMARRLVSLLPSNNLDVPAAFDIVDMQVKACSSIDDVINAVADDEIINIGQGKNQTVLASVGGNICGLLTLAQDKISADESSRLARFIRLCDAFSLPVISFVDTAGFENLQGAAKLSHAYAEATTVKITTIIGKAYGAAYIAAAGKSAGADVVLAWPTAVVLPLAPETAIHIFENDKLADMKDPVEDRKKLAEEYAQANGDVFAAASNGAITDIVSTNQTKSKLIALLKMFESKRVSRNPKKHSNIVL